MSTGYTRNDTTNNIANGNVVDASDLDGEFDAIQAAFDATTGHIHDGTVGGGAAILTVGPAQDVVVTSVVLRPKTDDMVDLGTSTLEFKDLYIDGVANIDSLVADTADINSGTIDGTTIGGASAAVGTFTTANATTVDTTNLEVTTLKAKDGTAAGSIADTTGIVTLASSVLTTTDINGGTIDNTSIGATTASTIRGTTITATTGFSGDVTGSVTVGAGKTLDVSAGTLTLANNQISGDKVEGGTINATTINTLTSTTVNATTVDTTNLEVTSLRAKDGTSAGSIANTTGVVTIPLLDATSLSISSTVVTATAAELNILDGVTATAAELNVLDGITANVRQLNSSSEDVNSENRIINGDMNIWQRGTSISVQGYAADRWFNNLNGGTVTQARSPVNPGDQIGGMNLSAVLTQQVSGQTLPSHYASTIQRIESVRSYSGQTITVLGWALRVSGSGNMGVQGSQHFGTGGSPSAVVYTPISLVTLTGEWVPFAVTFSVPSITGKTIGTNNNDFFGLTFFTSLGADYGGPIGLQTINVALWGIHIRVGTWTAADAALYQPRDPGTELALCQRYYEVGQFFFVDGYFGAASTNGGSTVFFKATKRANPGISQTNIAVSGPVSTTTNAFAISTSGFLSYRNSSAAGAGQFHESWTADAEL